MIPEFVKNAAELGWRDMAGQAISIVKACEPVWKNFTAAFAALPIDCREKIASVDWNTDTNVLNIRIPEHSFLWDKLEEKFANICTTVICQDDLVDRLEAPWLPVKIAGFMEQVGKSIGVHDNPHPWIVGGPRPVSTLLAGGLLGAGVGYGLGAIGEQFLPERWFEKGKLRRTGAVLGGLGGALPGTLWGFGSMSSNPAHPGWRAWFNGWPLRPQDRQHPTSYGDMLQRSRQHLTSPPQIFQQESTAPTLAPMPEKIASSSFLKDAVAGLQAQFPETGGEFVTKVAWSSTGFDGDVDIPVDRFNRVVWEDPYTPVQLRAATTGLLESAALVRNGQPVVTPGDVARIAVGMGSGTASGWLVGKTLGALAGLKPDAQRSLQQAGTWAGILQAVVPMAFGR